MTYGNADGDVDFGGYGKGHEGGVVLVRAMCMGCVRFWWELFSTVTHFSVS